MLSSVSKKQTKAVPTIACMAAHPSQGAWDGGFSPGGLQLNHSRHVGSVPSKFHLCQWFVIFCDGIVPECFKGSTSIWSRNKPPHTGKDFAVRSFHCWIVRIGVSPYDEGVHLSFFSGTAVDKTKRPLSQSQLFGPRSREKGFSPRGCQRHPSGSGGCRGWASSRFKEQASKHWEQGYHKSLACQLACAVAAALIIPRRQSGPVGGVWVSRGREERVL
jgi:hypothetical protein